MNESQGLKLAGKLNMLLNKGTNPMSVGILKQYEPVSV